MTSGSAARLLHRRDDDDVLAGLRAARKHMPSRLLYEAAGADRFDEILARDAYYPGRTELALLRQHGATIAHHVGAEPRVLEVGHVEGNRSRLLLSALERPSSYVAVDLAKDHLQRAAAIVRAALPKLEVQPITADDTLPFALPVPQHEWRRTLVFVPGSRIGNLEPSEARSYLKMLGDIAGSDRMLLLGADSTRDHDLLEGAYDDEVTAAFDMRVLQHLNATRGATFDLDAFEHRAIWNDAASRIELHLVSRKAQVVQIDGTTIAFAQDESIVTEHSYKHTPVAMQAILAASGWRPRQVFTATAVPYRLWLCEPLTFGR